MQDDLILITGAGGFIGGAMVADLRGKGHGSIRAVDIKPLDEWYQTFPDVENLQLDLNLKESCDRAARGASEVYNFAANMGGMGFIENNKALCMLSVLINTHMLEAVQKFGVRRYFYSSSACVYNADKQRDPANPGLKEEDAYPAMAEDGYGWEKLFSERMCRHFREDYGLYTRVARFHNVYGPHGTWDGGREKAPAAICRKVAEAPDDGTIEIWGDGKQTRSFLFIDECLEGVRRLMESDFVGPVNIGSEEMVTINQLARMAMAIAGKELRIEHIPGPLGVRGRNSDNRLLRRELGWAPSRSLKEGLTATYAWIAAQIEVANEAPALVGAPMGA